MPPCERQLGTGSSAVAALRPAAGGPPVSEIADWLLAGYVVPPPPRATKVAPVDHENRCILELEKGQRRATTMIRTTSA